MIVYLDIYFVINLMMDFIILCISKRIMKLKIRFGRILSASIVGGTFAIFYILANFFFRNLSNIGLFFVQLLFQIVGGVVMCLVAFRIKREKIITSFLVMTAVSFVLSGIVNYFYYLVPRGKSILVFVSTAIVSYIILNKLVDVYIEKTAHYKPIIYDVTLIYKDMSVQAKGLIDSGNRLNTPVGARGVHVVEKNLFVTLFSKIKLDESRIWMIPYNSVGKEGGSMVCLEIDKMIIDNDKEVIKPIIGLYDGRLSSKDKFNMLLNACLLNESL